MPERVAIGDSVLYQTVQDEVVLLNMSSQQYYGLDRIGADIWKILLECGDTAAVVGRMQEIYAVDSETCRRDLLVLIRELHAAQLLKIEIR